MKAGHHPGDNGPGAWEDRRLRKLAVLAVALNASFYVLVFVVLMSVIGALLAVVLVFGELGLYVIVFPAGVLAVAVRRIIVSARPAGRKVRWDGVVVTREDQPRLWAFVDETCQRVDQRTVDELRIAFAGSAAAGETQFGSARSRVRTVRIPLTYLAVLSTDELRGVVAHELSHFARGDASFRWRLVSVREALGRTLWRLERLGSVLRHPFRWYARLLSRYLASLSRQQEFAADAFAAKVFGADNVARGLRITEWVESAFEVFWRRELAPVLMAGLRPPVADGFVSFVGSSWFRARLFAFKPEDVETAFASHPTVVDRLAALRIDADPAPDTVNPSVSLLDGLDGLEDALLRDKQLPEGQPALRKAGWGESMQDILPRAWQQAAGALADQVPGMTAAEIGSLMDDHLGDSESSDEEKLSVVTAVSCALASALVRCGWSICASPGEPVRLLNGNDEIRPFQDVWAISRSVLLRRQWVERCHQAGIADLALQSPASELSVADSDPPEAESVNLVLNPGEASGPLSRGVTWVCWIAGALWIPILIIGTIQVPSAVGSAVMAGIAVLISLGLIGLFVSQRSLRRDPPRIRFDRSSALFTHPALLQEPLHISRQAIRVVAVDSRDRHATRRFPIFADSAWSDPQAKAAEPRGWFWVEGRPARPSPYFGLRKQVPNLVVILDEPLMGPAVRRQRLHGPLNGETLAAFTLTVAEPVAAEEALSHLGLARQLVMSDFRPLRQPTNKPRPREATTMA